MPSYYIAQIQPGPQGYVILKSGITGQNIDTRIYTRKRYGPGTKRLYGHKFHMSVRDLEKNIEKPILATLKTYDICEVSKNYFLVKEDNVPMFVELVKHIVFTLLER